MPVGTRPQVFNKDGRSANWPFRQLAGSLMRLSTQSLPDISNAVRALTRYSAVPKFIHWREALGMLGNMRKTSIGLLFRGVYLVAGLGIQEFADAGYASTAGDRRSVSGIW